jgi:hypothetical protein
MMELVSYGSRHDRLPLFYPLGLLEAVVITLVACVVVWFLPA